MDIVFACATAKVGTVMVVKGQHWPADDPIVRQQPSLFSADPRYGLTYTVEPDGMGKPVEQATAAPGEKRQTRRG